MSYVPPTTHTGLMIFIIILILLVLVAAGASIYYFMVYKPKHSPSPEGFFEDDSDRLFRMYPQQQ